MCVALSFDFANGVWRTDRPLNKEPLLNKLKHSLDKMTENLGFWKKV